MATNDEMQEIWATAMHAYVRQGGWKEVQDLIDSHATLFGSERGTVEGEFGEGEFAVYTAFRELAVKTLDNLLDELGCKTEDDEDRLCTWLKANAEKPSSGPREEVAKNVLTDLMSVDDFASFVHMMRKRNDELDATDLLEFAEPKLSAKHHSEDSKNYIEIRVTDEDDHHDKQRDQAEHDDEEDTTPPPLMTSSEWELQIGIAQSILTAHDEGKLREEDTAYVGWAQALCKIAKLMQSAGWDDDPELCVELYRELALHRFKVEVSVAQRAVFQERAARAEAARAVARAFGQEEEDKAHEARVSAALARCDELQREVAVSRGACVKDTTISDANLELAYLLIKTKLQKRQDLEEHAEEIYETLHGTKTKERPVEGTGIRDQFKNDQNTTPTLQEQQEQQQAAVGGIIVDLVRWCAIEAELSTVRKRVATMLGDADARPEPHTPVSPAPIASAAEWVECLDANTDYLYYVNPNTGESQWEKPPQHTMAFDETTQEKPQEEIPPTQTTQEADAKQESKDSDRAPPLQEDFNALPIKAEAKAPSFAARELVPAKLAELASAKSEAKQGNLAPPPLGLPAVPIWGRRLAPLGAPIENDGTSKSGLGLSSTALDFLKKRDLVALPETKPLLGLKHAPSAPPAS